MSEYILSSVDDRGIATITINRPDRKNAMGFQMLGSFIQTVSDLGADPAVRVIILTGGTEGCFCAGTDLSDLKQVSGTKTNLRGESDDRGRWWPLVACPKPIIAAIDGPAVGMGAEFTSQCDVRIATPRARFAWNFVHRGLIPDTGAGTWLLPRILGPQKALELLYSGEFLAADLCSSLLILFNQVRAPDQGRMNRVKREIREERFALVGLDETRRVPS